MIAGCSSNRFRAQIVGRCTGSVARKLRGKHRVIEIGRHIPAALGEVCTGKAGDLNFLAVTGCDTRRRPLGSTSVLPTSKLRRLIVAGQRTDRIDLLRIEHGDGQRGSDL